MRVTYEELDEYVARLLSQNNWDDDFSEWLYSGDSMGIWHHIINISNHMDWKHFIHIWVASQRNIWLR